MILKADDGSLVDTDKAVKNWSEGTRWDGHNHILLATGSQWHHQRLYLSSEGRFYLVNTSNYECEADTAEFLTDEQAAEWLLLNEHELPESLQALKSELTE